MARASIIIPCYNLGRYLDDAVTSVLQQTLQDFEILIIDDGSTDRETIDKLESYQDERIRSFRRDHRGVTATRNFGLSASSSEYVSFLDADDRLGPTFLERVMAHFEARPELAFVSFWVQLFGEESWVWKPERCDLRTLLTDCSIGTATVARRSAVLAAGGFDEDMELGHEDWELWLSLVERGMAGAIIPETLFHYRVRSPSRSTIANRFGIYLQLFRQRIRKHRQSYEQLLFEVVCDMEARNLSLQQTAGSGIREPEVSSAGADRPRAHSSGIARQGLSLVVPGPLTPAARAEKLGRLESITNRPVELVVVERLPSWQGARNRGVEAASQPYVVFMQEDDPLQTSFLELSCSLLDEAAEVSFVGSWGIDGLSEVERDAPQACDAAVMLARPLIAHLPTVFRRRLWQELGGFDETMGLLGEPDLFLRALFGHARGCVIESRCTSMRPWGEPAMKALEPALRPFFERHRPHFVRNLETVILAGQRRFLRVNGVLKTTQASVSSQLA